MKLSYSFELLTKQQGFSKEFLDKLSSDLAQLEKVAATPPVPGLKSMLPLFGYALAGSALAGTYGYFQAKKKQEEREKELSDSYQTLLLTHKNFAQDPSIFHQRFSELSLISPTVAANPQLARKIIEPRLSKGFDLDDVHRLSAIEHHTSAIPKVEAPLAAGAGHAASMLGRSWSNILFPLIATRGVVAPIGKEVHTIAKKIQPEKPVYQRGSKEEIAGMDPEFIRGFRQHKKEGSGGSMEKEAKLLVSEECLGRMLADRYAMFKTAGVIPKALSIAKGGGLEKSFTGVKNYLQMMAIPLMIGGGIQLVNQMMKKREAAQEANRADQVFAQLKRTSDSVRENMPIAQEAFDTLKSFAPALAAKPLVARTFVEHVISSEGRIPPDTTQMLANTQKMIGQLNEATGGGFIEGLKSPMGLFKHKVGGSKED